MWEGSVAKFGLLGELSARAVVGGWGTIDFCLSAIRNTQAAKRFLGKALKWFALYRALLCDSRGRPRDRPVPLFVMFTDQIGMSTVEARAGAADRIGGPIHETGQS